MMTIMASSSNEPSVVPTQNPSIRLRPLQRPMRCASVHWLGSARMPRSHPASRRTTYAASDYRVWHFFNHSRPHQDIEQRIPEPAMPVMPSLTPQQHEILSLLVLNG